jgi:hypothetical protein
LKDHTHKKLERKRGESNHTIWNWEQELKTWLDFSTGKLRKEWKDFAEERKKRPKKTQKRM